jgi:hypothetical protein
MNCVCGHPSGVHVNGGRCRVPDCPCERFTPGETFHAHRARHFDAVDVHAALAQAGVVAARLRSRQARDATTDRAPV